MKVFLAQMKPHLGAVEKNLKKMVEIVERAISEKSDLVIFPELSLTGYLLEEMTYDLATDAIPEELLKLSENISIIYGGIELGEDLYTYNTAYYLEDGFLKHKHRKVYLPTYGMFDEGRYFAGGDKIRAFDTKFGRVGMLICEDAWHQSSHVILAEDSANYIFVLTSSPTRGMMDNLGIAEDWYTILKNSAMCNTLFITMCNRVGVEDGVNFWGGSTAFSPAGDQIEKLEYFQEEFKIVELKKQEIRRARFASPMGKANSLDLVTRELERIKKSR